MPDTAGAGADCDRPATHCAQRPDRRRNPIPGNAPSRSV